MVLSPAAATGTIQNDDSTTLGIAAASAVKPEGNTGSTPSTPFTFTVTRSGDVSGTTTATYTVTGSFSNPTSATDFFALSLHDALPIFTTGVTSQTITID